MVAPKLSAVTPVRWDNSNGVLQVVTGEFWIAMPVGAIKVPQNLRDTNKILLVNAKFTLPVITIRCGDIYNLRNENIIFRASRGRCTSRGSCRACDGTHRERCGYVFNTAVSALLPYTVLIICRRNLQWSGVVVALYCPLDPRVVLEAVRLVAHIVIRTA